MNAEPPIRHDLRLPPSVYASLKDKARAERRSVNAQIVRCIEECLQSNHPEAS